MVLGALALKLFEPMATCPPHLLAWKMAFLVVITSARRVSEHRALRANLPYLTIHAEGATLFPDVSFLSKMFSSFYSNTLNYLLTFNTRPLSG